MSRRVTIPLTDAMQTRSNSTISTGRPWPVRVMLFLLVLIAGVVVLHLLTQWLMNRSAVESIVRHDLPTYRLRYRLLNMDREMSMPAWLSSLMLFGVGVSMWVAAWVHRVRREKGVIGWCALGLFFAVLSLDESAAIHEVLVPRVQALLGDYATGMLFYAWYVPVLVLCSFLLLMLWPFLRGLPRRTFWLLGLGIAVYLCGAVFFEALMGMAVEPSGTDEPPLQNPPLKMVIFLVMEEALEMIGITLLIFAMLDYLSPRLRLQVVTEPSAD